MVSFTHRITTTGTAAINELLCPMLDEAIAAAAKAEYEAGRGSGEGEVAKKRIGAGYIGTECARELGFRYHKHPKEDRTSSVSPGELNRHAQSGHWTEAKTAEWFGLVGITVDTFQRDPQTGSKLIDPFGKPKQIGWKAARDPETGQFRMAGEVDGIISAVENDALHAILKPPCIWESKKATDKKWKKFSKETVKKADPKYYGQLQANMAYMGVEQTLFSMLNLDNMKYYFEVVPFNQADAQAISDRAVKVLQSTDAFEMPRAGRSEDDMVCKFCDFAGQCWRGLVMKQPEGLPPGHIFVGAQAHESVVRAQEAITGAPTRIFNPNFAIRK